MRSGGTVHCWCRAVKGNWLAFIVTAGLIVAFFNTFLATNTRYGLDRGGVCHCHC